MTAAVSHFYAMSTGNQAHVPRSSGAAAGLHQHAFLVHSFCQVIKHVYSGHVVLQLDCTNTLNDQLLEKVSVEMEVPDGWQLVSDCCHAFLHTYGIFLFSTGIYFIYFDSCNSKLCFFLLDSYSDEVGKM
jgi:hypothetical protein